MFKLILLFAALTCSFAIELEQNYATNFRDINISTITKNSANDATIATIEQGKMSKKILSKELVEFLKTHGYANYTTKQRYINFSLNTPIDTSKLQAEIGQYYKDAYPEITIENVLITPAIWLATLPSEYKIDFDKKSLLQNKGMFSIEDAQNKKLYFNYIISAKISLFYAKDTIKKSSPLSLTNCFKKTIVFEKLRAIPVDNLATKQAKHHISKDDFITSRNTKGLNAVRKGEQIILVLSKEDISLTAEVVALEDGVVNDIIKVQNNLKKIFKAKIIAKDMVELE